MTTTPTAVLTAYFHSGFGESSPIFADLKVEFGTDETAARELAAKLPKSYGASVHTVGRYSGGTSTYYLAVHANLFPTEGNDRNETGIRRLINAERKLTALGVEIAFGNPADRTINAYRTREQFNAAIA
jgi:hypothetical protein